MVHETLKDLKSEVFSPKTESKVSEPLRNLNNEVCSPKLEAEDIEPVKLSVRPLT